MIWFPLFLSLSVAHAAPVPFFWGVSNAAFQTEGEPLDSDWAAWTKLPGKIDDATTAARAFGFYKNYEREFDAAKELGVNAFRLSIAWERVEPTRGKWDEAALAHYEAMMVALRKRGIEPIVTLHHFVTPTWLPKGVITPDFPERFALFAEHVISRLANGPAKVRWWVTLNEPAVLAAAGYLDGQFPPGQTGNLADASNAITQLRRAHVQAVARARALPIGAELHLGIATHWRPFEPANGWNPLDRIATYFADRFFNRQMMEAVTEAHDDFLGLNYYGRTKVKFVLKPPFVALAEGPGPKNDLGWEIYPEGLRTTLHELAEYHLPILITENGIADAVDSRRAKFIEDHVAEIDRARKEGIDVIGYLHWTLTDNFEWARGMVPKFGLCPAPDANGRRKCRPSFDAYREIIRRSGRE